MRGFPCSFGQTLAFLRVAGVHSSVSREKLSRFARRGAENSLPPHPLKVRGSGAARQVAQTHLARPTRVCVCVKLIRTVPKLCVCGESRAKGSAAGSWPRV